MTVHTAQGARLDQPKKTSQTKEVMKRFAQNPLAMIAMVMFVVFVALALIKVIEKSVAQLSDAAKEIAKGRVDIKLVKYNNDEFGELVDEYTKVIENIK